MTSTNPKPTIVILPGWRLPSSRFAPLVTVFKKHGFDVYCPDFPGFTEDSIPSQPLDLSDYVEFLRRELETKKIKQAVFIAHSFGGRVLLKFASLYPKYVRTIILSGVPGYRSINPLKYQVSMIIAKMGKLFFTLPGFAKLGETLRAKFYYVVGARDYYRANPVMRETFKAVVEEDLAEYMKQIQVPSLLLWGEDDTLVPVWVAQKMKATISDSTLLTIPGVGHNVPYKDPEQFFKIVAEFISKI